MKRIEAVYHITCPAETIESVSRDLTFEQTVEVPPALVTSKRILDEVVGRVEFIEPVDSLPGVFQVTVSYSGALACGQLQPLLNLLYGNISIKDSIRLVDFHLPEEWLTRFRGPNFGVEGIRRRLGVFDRPLLATALKPRGADPDTLAEIAYRFARGGGDIVKDDHNLIDASFEAFRERVLRCHEAVQRANTETGRATLYLPNLVAPVEDLHRFAELLLAEAVRGVLLSPFVLGLDTTRHLAERHPLIVMAHPALTGAFYHDHVHGIEPGLLLGKLFRLIGADASIYPNYGGRFTLAREECLCIADHLCSPLGVMRKAFPAPAGGMRLERIPSMAEEYGPDAIYLIGGALLAHSDDLQKSTEVFLGEIRKHFDERLEPPEEGVVSPCEIPSREVPGEVLEHLRFNENFSWQGRTPAEYKASSELPFEGVTRHELIGQSGERTAFDLRYFEIQPGGFTSLEKHLHTHTVIAARGRGVLVKSERRLELAPMDVAYIAPLESHQLCNESDQPFGFFCIVDHERDRPMAP